MVDYSIFYVVQNGIQRADAKRTPAHFVGPSSLGPIVVSISGCFLYSVQNSS